MWFKGNTEIVCMYLHSEWRKASRYMGVGKNIKKNGNGKYRDATVWKYVSNYIIHTITLLVFFLWFISEYCFVLKAFGGIVGDISEKELLIHFHKKKWRLVEFDNLAYISIIDVHTSVPLTDIQWYIFRN